ncbi:hypothetical protein OR1_03728 [Geobacter sp. OR-1]|uniref:MXAN_6640 family putative metalloprotease n=1 Tax=Geobacter sp. OR-1 TaxID=1266765 RepID=UPI0005432E47|nr:MXAN_6640 family putative metalloprotease [Geobacter sp. OR-1]GAM11412.1 hypothetical protein OR1_03728 [Geobacter sp. OR-1]
MKSSAIIITLICLFVFGPVSALCAGELDNHYLERFGELSRSYPVAGLSQAGRELPLDRCYTPVYHSLRHDWSKLAAGTQQVLAKYLAKPALVNEAVVRSAEGHFLIHYATDGSDAPPLSDANNNGIPDWVETVAAVFEAVYASEVQEMGYNPAPAARGEYDVYLQNLGGASVKYLGFTNAATPLSRTSYSSYIVIENDFAEFSSYSHNQLLQITAAHEYHHAIQYGYNYYFDIWYAEATSTWMEDEVFNSVNQLYDYLPGYLQNPGLPLDTPVSVTTGGGYGRWIFNRYLAEIKGRDSIKSIWELLATVPAPANGSDIRMVPIIDQSLAGELDQYVLGVGKRLVLRNWMSHQNEVSLIHPLLLETNINTISYPAADYSFAFYAANPQIDLSMKPAGVAAIALADALLLCNNLTGATVVPADPLQPIPSLQDAPLSGKAPTLVTGPAVSSPAQSGGGGGGCFIATAAYGSYLHPKVMVLRKFRDRWLMTNPVGRMLVRCYYRVSPAMAEVVARHKWLARGCRALLAPILVTVEHPETVAALLMGCLGWCLLRKRITE